MTRIVVIAGPTASGKSALALQIAQRFNGEIITADSMQLYKHLNIGTAKPTIAEQELVKHHLIDLFDFSERIDVYRFLTLAEAAIQDISERGKLPVIAGGTGMYLKALLYGLDDLPGDTELRTQLDDQYDNDASFEALRERMRELDPEALELYKDCRRKLIRALEVKLLSGESILRLRAKPKKLRYDATVKILDWPREILKERIAQRTAQMLDAGWIDEAQNAITNGLLESPTAHQALGYREIGRYLNGEITHKALEDRIITATWQFARRQLTWFRHQHPEAEQILMPDGAQECLKNPFFGV